MAGKTEILFHYFAKQITRVVLGFFFRVRAYGQESLPVEGGALLLSNHQSYLDPPLIGIAARRPLVYMARDTLFSNPLFAAVLSLVGVFPVKRGKSDKDAIRLAIEHLKAGEILVMFPEGRRTSDGRLQPIKGGFRLLVRRARVPVIPVAVDGTYGAWPRSRLLPRPRQVRINYGVPVPPEEFENLSDDEAGQRLTREISFLFEKLRNLP